MLLQKIISHKKLELKNRVPLPKHIGKSTRNFRACIKGQNNLIAEIKRKTPSSTKLKKHINLVKTVKVYTRYANAISVVTDGKFFGGSLKDLKEAKNATSLPIVRKDFIIDEYQILESRHYGADAVLLLASILSTTKINKLIKLAKQYNMDCIVEVHTKKELEKVSGCDAEIIGINNRNLDTFAVDLNTTMRLKRLISKGELIVSESGIKSKKDVLKVKTNAVLVGTSLLRAENMSKFLETLKRTKVKICGITNYEDAKTATQAGADYLGFIFYKKSPRYITPTKAKDIIKKLPNTVAAVGVFVNENLAEVNSVAGYCSLDMIQLHGKESPKYCSQLTLPVIKSFRINNKVHFSQTRKYDVFSYLFDAYSSDRYGGTGQQFNHNLLRHVKEKLFLSGGLTPENVVTAIGAAKPFCVDVNSGVERLPGKKDALLVKKFIAVVRKNDA